jgi:hypothetical protein
MVIEQSSADISLPTSLQHLEVKSKFNGNITFKNAVHLKTISMDCPYYNTIHDLPDSVHEITITQHFLARITRWPISLTDLIIKCDTHNLMFYTPLPKSINIRVT